MNKVKHLFSVLLLVMAQLPLCATNIELSWSFNQGDAKALQGTISKEGLFSYATASLGSDLEFLGTNKAGSLTVTKVQPKVKASNNGDGNAISFYNRRNLQSAQPWLGIEGVCSACIV